MAILFERYIVNLLKIDFLICTLFIVSLLDLLVQLIPTAGKQKA